MTAQETKCFEMSPWHELFVAQPGLLSSVTTEHSNVSKANTERKVSFERKILLRNEPQAFSQTSFDLGLTQPLVLMLF